MCTPQNKVKPSVAELLQKLDILIFVCVMAGKKWAHYNLSSCRALKPQ